MNNSYNFNCTCINEMLYMNNINFFTDIFESNPVYRKIVLLIFLIQNDVDFIEKYGY